MRRSRASKRSLPMGWLPGCHQIASWLVGSLTKNLSLGDRPVCLPVSAVSAPVETIAASSRRTACSYRAAGPRLRLSVATLSVMAMLGLQDKQSVSQHRAAPGARTGPERGLRDTRPARAGPAPLPAAHVVDQDVFAQVLRRDEKGPSLVDACHLVDELGQVRPALEHERVDHVAAARAAPHLAQRLMDGLVSGWVGEVAPPVVLEMGGRLAVRDHDDLPVAAVLRQHRTRALGSVVPDGAIYRSVDSELRPRRRLDVSGAVPACG